MSRQESLAGFRKAKLLAAVQGFQGFDPLFQEREDHMNCKHSWNPGGAFLLPNVCVCVWPLLLSQRHQHTGPVLVFSMPGLAICDQS